jgi:hypothetical protein
MALRQALDAVFTASTNIALFFPHEQALLRGVPDVLQYQVARRALASTVVLCVVPAADNTRTMTTHLNAVGGLKVADTGGRDPSKWGAGTADVMVCSLPVLVRAFADGVLLLADVASVALAGCHESAMAELADVMRGVRCGPSRGPRLYALSAAPLTCTRAELAHAMDAYEAAADCRIVCTRAMYAELVCAPEPPLQGAPAVPMRSGADAVGGRWCPCTAEDVMEVAVLRGEQAAKRAKAAPTTGVAAAAAAGDSVKGKGKRGSGAMSGDVDGSDGAGAGSSRAPPCATAAPGAAAAGPGGRKTQPSAAAVAVPNGAADQLVPVHVTLVPALMAVPPEEVRGTGGDGSRSTKSSSSSSGSSSSSSAAAACVLHHYAVRAACADAPAHAAVTSCFGCTQYLRGLNRTGLALPRPLPADVLTTPWALSLRQSEPLVANVVALGARAVSPDDLAQMQRLVCRRPRPPLEAIAKALRGTILTLYHASPLFPAGRLRRVK